MEARYLTDLEWRICHAVNIYVFKNGRDGEQPVLVHVPPSKKKNMRTLMNVIQERIKYPVGYAKYLFKMDGTRIRDPCELEMYNNYVVASNFEKNFKCASYGRKRSPLLVLNRESKHVRVLKLQNQNYYEWLLKKKAVGEERPPYIYPTYYTNENYRPQDLPVGQMGNYHPPEMQAPGCCYPRMEGKKTYRVEGNDQYVVNAVTVDVTPDLGKVGNQGRGQIPNLLNTNKQNVKNGKVVGKTMMIDRTPSDMVNANVLNSDLTSQGRTSQMSQMSSETEEQSLSRKVKNIKSKSHRNNKDVRNEFTNGQQQQRPFLQKMDSSNFSLDNDNVRKHKKAGKKLKKKKDQKSLKAPAEFGVPPPPPSQFRDVAADPKYSPQQRIEVVMGQQAPNNQDILSYVDRAIHDTNGNVAPAATVLQPHHQKTFYYSPEKLAYINSTTNIHQQPTVAQPLHHHPPNTGPWTIVHSPSPQQQQQHTLLPHIFALEPQPQPTSLYPNQAHYSTGVVGAYSAVQSLQVPQPTSTRTLQQIQGAHAHAVPMLLHSGNGSQPTQCVVFPNPNGGAASLQNGIPTAQVVTLHSPQRQSHMQQEVYQLGIVQQQPEAQNAYIQVDAKAMRQYVDNQKLIESRFGCGQQQQYGKIFQQQQSFQEQGCSNSKTEISSEQTESELDIPFTPMKTYRLNHQQQQQQMLMKNSNDYKRSGRESKERLLPKVKSRNVAIQMGFPGTNGGGTDSNHNSHHNNYNPYRGFPTSEVSFIRERGTNPFRMSDVIPPPPPDVKSSRVGKPLESDRREYLRRGVEKHFLESNHASARNSHHRPFYGTVSDHFLNLRSSRTNNAFMEKGNVTTRSLKYSSDPILEELVTIPPPTEFRESMRYHRERRHQHQHHRGGGGQPSNSFKNDDVSPSSYPTNKYPPTTSTFNDNNNNDRSNNMQYINSHYQ